MCSELLNYCLVFVLEAYRSSLRITLCFKVPVSPTSTLPFANISLHVSCLFALFLQSGARSAVEVVKNHSKERMEDRADRARMRARDYAKLCSVSLVWEEKPILLLGPPFNTAFLWLTGLVKISPASLKWFFTCCHIMKREAISWRGWPLPGNRNETALHPPYSGNLIFLTSWSQRDGCLTKQRYLCCSAIFIKRKI